MAEGLGEAACDALTGAVTPSLAEARSPTFGEGERPDVLPPLETFTEGVPAEILALADGVESTFVSTLAEATGVETPVLAVAPRELAWTFVCTEAAGVDALPEPLAPVGAAVALAEAEPAGVDAVTLTDAVGALGCALAPAETELAGAVTLTLALAGADVDGALTVAVAETGGETGVPGRPSACADAAKDRLQRATARTTEMERRKLRFRSMIVSSLRSNYVPRGSFPSCEESKRETCNPGRESVKRSSLDKTSSKVRDSEPCGNTKVEALAVRA